MKMKELGWKEKHGIQNTGTKDSKGNIRVDMRKVLKIWENYIPELYDKPNRPENLEVETGEGKDPDKKALILCKVPWNKLSRSWGKEGCKG
jgi:hypothetical protein